MNNKVIVNGVDMIELIERDAPYKIKNPYIEKSIYKGDPILKESHCKCKNEINNGFQFCPYCGQRLDWSKEDE